MLSLADGSPEAIRLLPLAREILAESLDDPRRAGRPRSPAAAYLEGDFLLRSGRRSKYYLDKYRFETRPDLLGPIGDAIAAAVSRARAERDAARRSGARSRRARGRGLALGRAAVPDRAWGRQGVRHRQPPRGRVRAGRAGVPRRGRRHLGRSGDRSGRSAAGSGLEVRNAVCVVDREEGGVDGLARAGVRLEPLYRASELRP